VKLNTHHHTETHTHSAERKYSITWFYTNNAI